MFDNRFIIYLYNCEITRKNSHETVKTDKPSLPVRIRGTPEAIKGNGSMVLDPLAAQVLGIVTVKTVPIVLDYCTEEPARKA